MSDGPNKHWKGRHIHSNSGDYVLDDKNNVHIINKEVKMSTEVKAQKVEVAVKISGCYAAFHELSFTVMYDYTNDILIDTFMTKEEVDERVAEGHDGDYSDANIFTAYLINGKYYLNL